MGRAAVALLKAQEPKIFVISFDSVAPSAESVQPDQFIKVELEDYGPSSPVSLSPSPSLSLRSLTARACFSCGGGGARAGEVLAALIQVDTRYSLDPRTAKLAGIVHMAANPNMGSVPNHVMYRTNTLQVRHP